MTELSRPLIGLTGDIAQDASGRPFVKVNESYCRALTLAGACPVVLYPAVGNATLATIRRRLDGLLFTGGGDLAAANFGEPAHATAAPASPQRQSWDLRLMRAALTWKLPILAICLGLQELNVAYGGTLHQHVPDLDGSLVHRSQGGAGDAMHEATVVPGTALHRIIGCDRLRVNSAHHQCIAKLGAGLRISARADDGLVEAVEPDGPGTAFVIGVQWHPERIVENTEQQALFAAFLAAARQPISDKGKQ